MSKHINANLDTTKQGQNILEHLNFILLYRRWWHQLLCSAALLSPLRVCALQPRWLASSHRCPERNRQEGVNLSLTGLSWLSVLKFCAFLYLRVYVNLPCLHQHLHNLQVSQFGSVVETCVPVLLLRNQDKETRCRDQATRCTFCVDISHNQQRLTMW